MKKILAVIVFAQFAGTSLWFAGNAVIGELVAVFSLDQGAIAHCTSLVQLGFISGTLIYAFGNFADRFRPRTVFLTSAILAAIFNMLPVLILASAEVLYVSRLGVGFFLAGIYPVGMKIASDWYKEGLGVALGFLVGALVLGTAFPHLLKTLPAEWEWKTVLTFVSALSVLGAVLLFATVGEGPHRKKAPRFNPLALKQIFSIKAFRAAAAGYFGHMWELYAYWAFIPVILKIHASENGTIMSISMGSFLAIAMGSAGCVAGGYWSRKWSSAKVALFALAASCLCCLIFPLAFQWSPEWFFAYLAFWGFTVVMDSPQFSTLNARTAPREWIGSALTIATCIGFAITILSIQLLQNLLASYDISQIIWILALGPALGIWQTLLLVRSKY